MRLTALCAAVLALVTAAFAAKDDTRIGIVPVPPKAKSGNSFYVGNREPLLPSPLIKLPIGSIRPEGWVRTQLELMADGFTGHLPELSEFCKFEGNAWISPEGQGDHGWEELPYWLKGYVALGYVLQDQRIIDDSKKWIEGMLSNQRADGYFGPEANRAAMDLWPNMPALHTLRSYYEYSGDKRVLKLMSAYFKWQQTVPFEKLLPPFWQKIRGGDNLDSIYWLYNRTGEPWLLDAARVIHERTADWTGGIASWHGVNIGQAFREPGEYYQQTKDIRYLKAAERNYDVVMQKFGQVPGGLFGADENAREGFFGPRQAAETCTMVEMMYSHEMLCAISGNPVWADRCEEIAFNSFPASMTPDLKGLHYLTAPNLIQLDHASKSPMIQNGGDMFSYNPYRYRCCQHNVAMGWPYYSEHMWMATQGNGLAAVLYGPNAVTAKVGNGVEVRIEQETDYPFDEVVELKLSTPRTVKFPLLLRIPGWCEQPVLSINAKQLSVTKPAKGWLMIDRTWQDGDTVRLEFPAKVELIFWEKNRNTVSVNRGPLTYSLKIGEDWRRYGGTDEWPGYEVFPTTPWNYGLVLGRPETAFRVIKKRGALAKQPFALDAAPIEIRAVGRRIPQWKQELNGLVGEVQPSPVKSSEPDANITLIPMGCARLRISAFPHIGDRPDAIEWSETSVIAQASFTSFDLPSALNDQLLPSSSGDTSIPRFTWWDHTGTAEWVQYTFSKPTKISWCEVCWFDDGATGGGCRVPQS